MDWGYKTMLTSVTVAAVLMAAQLFGRRLAGMLAGLPVITAPVLLWLTYEQGAAFAAASAVGSVAACGSAAFFALAYGRLSRRCGPAFSMAASLACGGLVALLLAPLASAAWAALAAVALACLLVLRLLPRAGEAPSAPVRARSQIWVVAVAAGAMSGLVGLVAPHVGPYWSGLLASLPIISACVLLHEHLHARQDDIHRYLRGYVTGLGGKALFAVAFGALVPILPAALALLLSLGLALLLVMYGPQVRLQPGVARTAPVRPTAGTVLGCCEADARARLLQAVSRHSAAELRPPLIAGAVVTQIADCASRSRRPAPSPRPPHNVRRCGRALHISDPQSIGLGQVMEDDCHHRLGGNGGLGTTAAVGSPAANPVPAAPR
jgi:hypothetical protein